MLPGTAPRSPQNQGGCVRVKKISIEGAVLRGDV